MIIYNNLIILLKLRIKFLKIIDDVVFFLLFYLDGF